MSTTLTDAWARRAVDRLCSQDPALARGQVWCRTCGATRKVDSAECLRSGWPLCCGETMTIDDPRGETDARASTGEG